MTASAPVIARLAQPVDELTDHILGPVDAPITLVEYGSYDCPHCRAANARIAAVRRELGDRMRYVFRHRPIPGSALARQAAELVETARDSDEFWNAHVALMTRSANLTEDDLEFVASTLGLDGPAQGERRARAAARVDRDVEGSIRSGVRFTPTFFINGRRYDGAWDESSFTDALLGSLGYRVRVAALTFASWAPAAGLLLLIATALALAVSNSTFGAAFDAFWHTTVGLRWGEAAFDMALRDWINDALLTIFFLVVGLEIKRELTVGHLAKWRAAALPIAAAAGGMALPALIYLLVVPSGPWQAGWGVPIATDTAFAVALIAMMGSRVPIELRIFLTAAAIVDDIGAIVLVALFYSGELEPRYLGLAALVAGVLMLLNRSGVYRTTPYLMLGVVLWAAVHAGGLHATLAGVVLAALIPTRPPPNYDTLAMQADSILLNEARHRGEQLRLGPSEPALLTLDAINDRLLSPAERLFRHSVPRSSFVVLPLFALANAGVDFSGSVFAGHAPVMFAIGLGLVLGKPLGFLLLSLLAVWFGIAAKSDSFSWRQLAGAGALAGIGFTMSLFIAGQAFAVPSEFAAAKVAVLTGSVVSAAVGVALLWGAQAPQPAGSASATDLPADAPVTAVEDGRASGMRAAGAPHR